MDERKLIYKLKENIKAKVKMNESNQCVFKQKEEDNDISAGSWGSGRLWGLQETS